MLGSDFDQDIAFLNHFLVLKFTQNNISFYDFRCSTVLRTSTSYDTEVVGTHDTEVVGALLKSKRKKKFLR